MINKRTIIWVLMFAVWISCQAGAMAGWRQLHFKPLHIVWGQVGNSNDGTNADGRDVSLNRGGEQLVSTIVNNIYYFNAFRFDGDTWAPGQTLNASLPAADGYDAGPVSLINPPSQGIGIERMVDMTLGPVVTDENGTQINITCFMEGFYDPQFGEAGHDVEQQEAIVMVEARTAPDAEPTAVAEVELGVNGNGQNGFGVDLDGDYYIVIRHTNHLAVRTVNTIRLLPEGNPPAVVNTAVDELYQEAGYDTPLTASGERMVLRGGDFDNNGRVNAQDLVVWQNANGGSPGMDIWDVRADGTGDDRVNAQDLILWQLNNGLISYVVYH